MDTPRKLYRSKKDRIIGGVCGGLAKYFNIDPWIVRLIFIGLAFADGLAIIAYIILLIVVPEDSGDEQEVISPITPSAQTWLSDKKNLAATALIVIGAGLLLKQFLPWHWLTARFAWAVAIIIIGIFLFIKKKT